MRKRIVATGSPASKSACTCSVDTVPSGTSASGTATKSNRVVTKRPVPSPVRFGSEIASITERDSTRSPTTSGRAYCCSQLVATTEVSPSSSSRPINTSLGPLPCSVPAARASSTAMEARRPRMIQACSMVGGAMSRSCPAARAASSDT